MSSAESTVIEADKQVPTRHLPGDLAMWCFILAELLAFLLLLGSMAFARGHWNEMFSAGIATLHPEAGLVNTLILLTGSYFAANAVKRTAAGDQRALSRGFILAALCGLAYVAIKITEYGILFGDGYNLRTDTFYFFYFFTTFFHMAHVLIGMAILLVVAQRSRAGHYANQEKVRMAGESAASYWHMVDLVWLVLFPLLYVLP
ncbi:cytochrome c oxidase subunit 3 [Halopseudomonas sp. SMJS2]|uniref:cytochrome c oxidase subunit 3 n=1 Tax=Halopseudomonas sp. SMJS2 TaxID=3041098 RepID=UPI002452FC8A|nr:cytochrome c oxidase subunit 3 [Halopseudomonas sp. SMJS2]WGK60579.1 cytochrome c oxidase subunit 3 [Halopseudomonas sp. SMJS2]